MDPSSCMYAPPELLFLSQKKKEKEEEKEKEKEKVCSSWT